VETVLIPHLPSLASLQATNNNHRSTEGAQGQGTDYPLQSAESAAGWEDASMQSTTGHTTLCISSQVCACTFVRNKCSSPIHTFFVVRAAIIFVRDY